MSSSAAEQDAESDQVINEEFKIWKKNCPFLYDVVVTHALEWPSLTCDWLPDPIVDEEKHCSVHQLVLGTHCGEGAQNALLLANVTLPLPSAGWDDVKVDANADESEGKSNAIEIVKRFAHNGEIHRARHMPQNSKMIATIGPSGDVTLYNTDQKESSKNGGVVGRGKSHGVDGYGLRWSHAVAGRLVSAANDGSICFWDANNPTLKMSPVVKLSDSTNAKGSINDIALSSTNGDVCWAVGEEKRIDTWDARKGSKSGPTSSRANAHDGEIMCVDASMHKEHLLLTGGADSVVKLWDSRNMKTFLHSMEGCHSDDVTSVRWSPTSASFFMSSGGDRRVNVWDLGRIGQEQNEEDGRDGPPELLFVHGGHTGVVDDVAWCTSDGGNGFLVASVADDNIVQCWQMQKSLYAEEEVVVDAMELEE